MGVLILAQAYPAENGLMKLYVNYFTHCLADFIFPVRAREDGSALPQARRRLCSPQGFSLSSHAQQSTPPRLRQVSCWVRPHSVFVAVGVPYGHDRKRLFSRKTARRFALYNSASGNPASIAFP
jgi:hypothetical protein